MSNKAVIAAIVISAVSLCASGTCIGLMVKDLTDDTQAEGTVTAAEASQESTVQYVMYVGTNDKDTYKPEHTREEAMQIVDGICLKYFDGYTLQEATGSWKDESDNITHEYTIVCYFDGADRENVYHAADDIIAALNQNTVLIEKKTIDIDYYSS